MLTIRLTRKGRKNQPFFRVVVIDKKRSAKGGRAVEILGYVDPLNKKKSLKKERILHWIKNGAKPSDTIHNLLISEKIISGKKINVSKKSKKKSESPKVEAVSSSSVTPENNTATPQLEKSSEAKSHSESANSTTGEKPKEIDKSKDLPVEVPTPKPEK